MRLPVDEAGDGSTVVLLHARPADRTMWRRHLPLLADGGAHAIAVDLPGYGQAPASEIAPWTAVLDTVDALGVDRFALAGNSLGALIALHTTIHAPERVTGLVLVGYRPHDQPASPRLTKAWEREQAALQADDLDAAVQAGVQAWTAESAAPQVKAHATDMLRNNLRRQYIGGDTPPEVSDPAALDELSHPALIAVGEHDMPDFYEGGAKLAAALDAGELNIIPGAGHLAPLEQPESFSQLLLGFLN
ncbi:alpha/beta fold hydrolase [Saccharopolyspora phatthalungensis]|uniref:Pimeloyl-ACP methyl ester carboxylesterase n=1 Tax=Saccharopolyspora phatthalungensis TaxID=664693 RepID=A0A840QG80_9PSEU|nr:alpha/beta hydrolase [Saccharopolyspora phatthalungensis]MBB5159107.1 pimeloyl-ACP methyl ester carboxylesterase [Saccharopolyspora phatthalungensis]